MGMPELWWRNPSNYVKELIECNETNLIFDYGWIIKKKIKDPQAWAELYYGSSGAGKSYRLMLCGTQGTAEFSPKSPVPVAVYPTWQYGEDEAVLESYMMNPVGEDKELCFDEETPILERPVFGQEHRVVVMNFPNLNTGPGKMFLKLCKELQEEYPDTILHVHGATTVITMARIGFKAFDWESRNYAAMGNIMLPMGKIVNPTKQNMLPYKEWIRLCGFKPVDLMEPRNRCIYNIRSARWAVENFAKDIKLSFRPRKVDMHTPDADYEPEESLRIFTKVKVTPEPGDKFVCNSCSLAVVCKFYREGSVCTVPKSEPKELASYFRTRDVDSIIDGLSAVVQINSDRLEKGLAMEELTGLDPEVTRIAKTISDQGEKLAKLIDPTLRSPKVQVNVGSGSHVAVGISDPRQVVAAAIRELEQQGYKRDEITPQMMEAVLRGTGAQPREIEGTVVSSTDDLGGDLGSRYSDLVPVPEMPF